MRRPAHNVHEFRRLARRRLPKAVFDFVDGGAEDEVTVHRNEDAFRRVALLPRLERATLEPSVSTTLFGEAFSLPLALAPCGGLRLIHPDGAIGAAKAAAASGLLTIVSAASSYTLEEIAQSLPAHRMWFQLYSLGTKDSVDDLVRRADRAGYGALVVTLDTLAIGNRERDIRNGDRGSVPLEADETGKLVLNSRIVLRYGPAMMMRPGWLYNYMRAGRPFGRVNARPVDDVPGEPAAAGSAGTVQSPTWDDLAHIRRTWDRPLLLKGILNPDDARRAVALGADGVIVSNHGGRQLDGVPSTLSMLSSIRAAVGKASTVLVDGGVRRGTDVLKARALGADAALIGRPYVWGLAVGGEVGVAAVLRVLMEETVRAATLLGCHDLAEVDASWCQV